MKKTIVKALLFYKDSGKYYLLLLERSKQLFHGMEDLPGGKLEPDELPIPGLMREIKEETQIDVENLSLIATHEWEDPSGTQYFEYLYCAFVDTNIVIPNPDEHSSFRWVELEKIEHSKIHPKIKELILANFERIKELLKDY